MSSEGVRITDLEEVTTLRADDFAMVDSPTRNESKKYLMKNITDELALKANSSDLATVATSGDADDVNYDNTTSGLIATNVQDAIDEVLEKADKVQDVKVNDVSVVDANKIAQINLKAQTIIGVVSDLPQAVASFSDGGTDTPLNKLEVGIEPIQSGSGDPSPTNIRPISGWSVVDVTRTGKNLFDKNTTIPNKRYTLAGVEVTTSSMCHSDFIRVVPLTSYYGLFNGTKDVFGAVCFDKNKQPINTGVLEGEFSNHVFIAPENCYYVALNIGYDNNNLNDVCLNVSNQTDDGKYFPSLCNTYTIQLGDTYYGGKLDVVNGVLTINWVRASGLNWYAQSGETQKSYYSDVIDNIKLPTSIYTTVGAISSDYMEGGSSNFVSSGDGKFCISQGGRININDNRYQSLADFKVAIPNIDIVYELATPTTIQLTPTQVRSLLGNNNIFADTGNVLECEYAKDATITINDILARLEALENA